tara:strand:+ start:12745 stop:13278 length:534 start_codon:yes stop_codon:yes gene_type:complete
MLYDIDIRLHTSTREPDYHSPKFDQAPIPPSRKTTPNPSQTPLIRPYKLPPPSPLPSHLSHTEDITTMSLHLDYTHLDASPPRSCRAFASPPPPYAANPPPIAHAVWHDVVASARAHRVMADPTNPASPDFAAVRRRLHQELAAMERESVPGICVGVVGGNLVCALRGGWWCLVMGV